MADYDRQWLLKQTSRHGHTCSQLTVDCRPIVIRLEVSSFFTLGRATHFVDVKEFSTCSKSMTNSERELKHRSTILIPNEF